MCGLLGRRCCLCRLNCLRRLLRARDGARRRNGRRRRGLGRNGAAFEHARNDRTLARLRLGILDGVEEASLAILETVFLCVDDRLDHFARLVAQQAHDALHQATGSDWA